MNKVSKHIDQLISRYLSGETSSSEKLLLEQWLAESDDNKKYFDQIKFIYDKASKTYPEIDFNVDKAWGDIRGKMKYTPKAEIKVQKPQWGWLKIAASLVAIIGISTIIYLSIREKTATPTINTIAVTTTDSTIDKKLPDSTQVYLNKSSKLTYNPDYGEKNREVSLEGEAYFNATHLENKPLVVKVEGTFIKDIGTSFNIKAYPDEDIIEVYVESGKVIFYSETDAGLTLAKGDVGIYSKVTKSFSKKQTVEANILSYKTKSFTFINASLKDVIRQLNGVYCPQISIKNSELGNCTINVSFENESLETIVDIIAETLELKLSKTSDGYILDGVKCNNL